MSLIRGLGYRPDDRDPRDWDAEDKLLSTPSGVASASVLLPHVPIYNQGRTSTCVGQTMAGGTEILERAAGYTPVKTPSRLFIYFNSRQLHAGKVRRLFDTGTHLRTAAKAMSLLGVPDEEHWAFSQNPLRVNRRPSTVASMRGKARSDGEYYRILSSGWDRVRAVKAALLEGYPVAFGLPVTNEFLKNEGPSVFDRPSEKDSFVGGHAMLIVGYENSDDGLRFLIRNSWGTGWRDDGYAWFTEDHLTWSRARDFQIIKGWKRLQENKS